MKIGFITLKHHAIMAGTEKVLSDMLLELRARDIETKTYFIYEPKDSDFIQKIGNHSIAHVPNILKNKHILRPRALYKIMHKKGVKKLFDEIKNDNLDALFILKIEDEFLKYHHLISHLKTLSPSLKIISWPHCDLAKIMTKHQNFKKYLSLFDSHFAISDGSATQLEVDLKQNNVITIYNPTQAALPIKRNPHKFLYIGRIDDNKRVYELLENLQEVKHTHWSLDIYGTTGNSLLDKKFQDFINSLTIKENIIFHGWTTDPWDQISEAGILFLNSLSEGFALVLIEAMMRGIPCISSNCPVGPSSIIENGKNGWLVDLHNSREFIMLVDNILSKNTPLPPVEQVIQSVQKFEMSNVANTFINALSNELHNDK